MSKVSREVLLERTTEAEVFQDMDNFDLLNDSSTFALSLRLQFPKFSKGFTSSDFEPFVRSHVGESNLVSLGRLSFPNEWQMQVADKDVRESLIRMGRTKINTRTCWISPLSQSEVRGFIHWIPTAVSNKKLESLLGAYGEVLLMENQKQNKWTCKVESDARYFGLYLKSGKTMDDVPHFIKVNDYHGLITIRGRNPACFHCKEIGHRKSECKMFREKVSDYSSRPPHSAKPRLKPRGKRHNPKKGVEAKSMDQGVQTAEEATCAECLKEQLAAKSEVLPVAAEASGVSVAEGMELSVEITSETGFFSASARQLVKDLEIPSVQDPVFQTAIMKKTKKQIIAEEFNAKVEAIRKGPFLDLSKMAEELKTNVHVGKEPESSEKNSVAAFIVANVLPEAEPKKNSVAALNAANVVPEAEPKKNSVAALNAANVVPEQGAVVQKAEGADSGPLVQLEQLQRNIEEILAKTRETLEREFEASRQMLMVKEAEKSVVGEGKKKRKKRKKKKSVVEVEVEPSSVPKDFI